MDNYKHPIDEYFREALKDYEPVPSDRSRDAFLESAGRSIKRSRIRRNRWFLAAFLLLAGAGSLSTWLMFNENHDAPRVTVSTLTPSPLPSPNFTPSKQNGKAETGPELVITESARPEIPTLISFNASPASDSATSLQTFTSGLPEEPSMPDHRMDETTLPEYRAEPSLEPPDEAAKPPYRVEQDGTETERGPDKSASILLSRNGASVTVGVSYTPEWMFNTLEGDNFAHNAALEGTFRFGRYSIRTGAGVSVTKGTHEVAIRYNDYIGSYKALDSITFAWNPEHTQLIPTLYLTNQDVFDSLILQEEHAVVRRYTYLQVPLILGYDFISRPRFTLGVRTGPVLSILLGSRQLSANYDPGKDKIIMVNQITPDRIQMNWQVMGGINFSYLCSRRWGLELEPEARYYFNSVYEPSDITQKPWSIGIRAAVNFNFSIKK